MLVQCRRRWANIKPSLGQRVLLHVLWLLHTYSILVTSYAVRLKQKFNGHQRQHQREGGRIHYICMNVKHTNFDNKNTCNEYSTLKTFHKT